MTEAIPELKHQYQYYICLYYKEHLCLYQQEVFEARYLKVPQEAEGRSILHQRDDKGKGDRVESVSTSASSESESSSEAESSSEEVTMQLANLEERVGIYLPVTVQMAFQKLFTSVHLT